MTVRPRNLTTVKYIIRSHFRESISRYHHAPFSVLHRWFQGRPSMDRWDQNSAVSLGTVVAVSHRRSLRCASSWFVTPFCLNMLVYRILRALSDRALDFYSEVHVEGQHNVPANGPLIVYVYTRSLLLHLNVRLTLFRNGERLHQSLVSSQ